MGNDLSKIIDLKVVESILKSFNSSTNLSAYMVDLNNQEMTSSEFPFFCQIIRSKKPDICSLCRQHNLKEMLSKNEDIKQYQCDCGLFSLIAPLKVNNITIGSIVINSIKKELNDNYKNISTRIEVGQEELLDELNKLKDCTEKEIELYKQFLKFLSQSVSNLAYQKQEDTKKISELTIIHKITHLVNSTHDLEKILKIILDFMTESTKAEECSIYLFNNKKRYGTSFNEAYSRIETAVAAEIINSRTKSLIPELKKDYRFTDIDPPHNSLLSLPLRIKDEVIGMVNIYGNSTENLGEHDIEFLSILTDQVAIAVENARNYEIIKESSITDKLTNTYNRRYFIDLLKKEITRNQRSKKPTSIMMFDIDDFKNYNDTYGHPKGDELLKELAEIVKEKIRSIDTVGRYGGEEFIIILPETPPQEAKMVGERILKAISNNNFYGKEQQPLGKITVSIGLLSVMNSSLSDKAMIQKVDELLYKAKDQGKNCLLGSIIVDKNMGPVDLV